MKVVVVFVEPHHFARTRSLIEPSCGPHKAYPTTTFNRDDLSMTIEHGEILNSRKKGCRFKELRDSGQNKLTVDMKGVKRLSIVKLPDPTMGKYLH